MNYLSPVNRFIKKKLPAIILLLIIAVGAHGQTTGKITGRVIDSASGQPVEFASVSLAQQADDKEINGMMTDDKGVFVITDVAYGAYRLHIFSIGYKSTVVNNIVVSKTTPAINTGDIKLTNTSSKLNEVTIAADKSTVEYKVDKTVYNVDKDLTSQTGVAADVLKKIPQVEVDVDGNVELQGNPDVKFLIDGKPSTVFGNNLADVLQSIPASQIQSIEVITSPGAKYDAEGTAGIINIILKKSTAQGINGNVSLSGGTRLENGSFNLNARKGNFGAHAYFSGNGQLSSTTLNSINRSGQDTGSTYSKLIQNGPSDFSRGGYQTGIGFDWEITGKDNITANLGYNYYTNQNNGTVTSETILTNAAGNVLSDAGNYINLTQNAHQSALNSDISYKHTFDKKDQELDILVSNSSGNNYSYYMQTQQTIVGDTSLGGSYGDNPGTSKETDISVDYSQPVGKSIVLQGGAKTVLQDIASTSDIYLFNSEDGTYSYNAAQSSSLDYKSNVYAGYLSASFQLYKWLDVNAGMRYEYTHIDASYSTSGDVNIQPYGLFIPSVIFSHAFKNEQVVKLSYNRRIQRPSYYNLNPFVNAANPQYIFAGNPGLQPEIGDKLELSYNKIFHKGGDLNLTLFYRDNTHDIQSYSTYYPVYKVGDSTYNDVSVTIPENIGHETNIGTNIYVSIPVKKRLTVRSNISLYQRYIVTGLPTGGDISGFNYRLNLNATYKFTKTLSAEAFGNYNSKRINAQGTYPAFFTYNFAIRKDLFNEKGSIAITATNPFNYYVNQTANLTGSNFTVITTRELPYQSFGFNFTYKFGKLEFKKEKETEDPNLSPQEG